MIHIVANKTNGFFYDAVKEHFPSGYTKICIKSSECATNLPKTVI
jgi:hypothetical protein